MNIYGTLYLKDTTHIDFFQGTINYSSIFNCIDNTSLNIIFGYIVSDTTKLVGDQTYYQNSTLNTNNLTLTLSDWTYFGGRLNDDGTWVDGTFKNRWYDPLWVRYSIWSQSYDTSAWSLVEYKQREPIRNNVGSYYASMVVPNQAGHYEIRWVYLKDNSSYAHEKVNSFVSMSNGLDFMPDYPKDRTDHN